MTLEEAIKHCHEKAEELRKKATHINENPNPTEFFANSIREAEDCLECAKEHEQLATWLEELLEWHRRVEISKNGRYSIIVQGVPLFLTQGHIDALLEYERNQTIKEVVESFTKPFNVDFPKDFLEVKKNK